MVVMFRGGGKSTECSMVYPCWRTLHIKNFTAKLISNTSDNVKHNFFLPLVELFTESPRANYLQWLYQEEIPTYFRGWNSETINWVKTRPEVGDSISYWGIDSKWEGAHPDLIVLDDPDGAEALKSVVTTREAMAAYERALPLRKNPRRSQVLIVCTPWGDDAFAYQIRDAELDGELDNEHREVKVFWKPLLNDNEENESCLWPERFPDEVINQLKKTSLWGQQYMLRRRASTVEMFTMDAIDQGCYRRDPYDYRTLDYMSVEFDPDKLEEGSGKVRMEPVRASVSLDQLRYFLHIDPIHKTDDIRRTSAVRSRPMEAAQLVVGVASDMHVFEMEPWTRPSVSLDEQFWQAFRLYCKYACHLVTCEYTGAQAWFRSFCESMERAYEKCAHPVTDGTIFEPFELPPMSSRLVGSDTGTPGRMAKAGKDTLKEYYWRERLSPWLNARLFHLNGDKKSALYTQIERAMDESVPVDLLDCACHGPGRIPEEQINGRTRPDAGKMVWSAPLPREYTDQLRRRARASQVLRDPKTGFFSPWRAGRP